MSGISQINPATVQTPSFKAKKIGAKEVQKLLDRTNGYAYAAKHSKEELREIFVRDAISNKINNSFWDGVMAYFKNHAPKGKV